MGIGGAPRCPCTDVPPCKCADPSVAKNTVHLPLAWVPARLAREALGRTSSQLAAACLVRGGDDRVWVVGEGDVCTAVLLAQQRPASPGAQRSRGGDEQLIIWRSMLEEKSRAASIPSHVAGWQLAGWGGTRALQCRQPRCTPPEPHLLSNPVCVLYNWMVSSSEADTSRSSVR